jgi:hypothetical protein
MKTKFLSRIILVGVAALLLEACATTASGPAGLAGTWKNSMGTVWTIRADGSFDVDLNREGKRDAWGNCTFQGDTMNIVGTGGKVPKECATSTGVYHFKRTGDKLHFTLVSDPCKLRAKNVTQDWTKK